MAVTATAARTAPPGKVDAAEQQTRIQLAAVYRIFARMGMDDLIYTHISARVPGPERHFLINPFGLMYEEVCASNLVKIDLAGNPVEAGAYPVNHAGFVIHSAFHEGTPNANCVIHLHSEAGCAVAAQKDGLLPLSQYAFFSGNGVAYHDYEGLALDAAEKGRLVAHLGDRKWMVLRNHGLLTVGRTVAEAFFHMYNLEKACRIQVAAMAGGKAALEVPPEAVQRKTMAQRPVGLDIGDWGEKELAAWMRKLDREAPDYRS
jgi:ribulose-5-phosphate 4-epimerase/fuculose-1-phosphate aldolase